MRLFLHSHPPWYLDRTLGLAAAGNLFLHQTALDISTFLTYLDANDLDLPGRTAAHLDFAMRLALERDFLGLDHSLDQPVAMTLAQVRQQIHFLLFRDRGIGPGDRDAGLGELFQQAIHRYADDRRKLFDRYIRHLPPPRRAHPTARSSKTKALAPS